MQHFQRQKVANSLAI